MGAQFISESRDQGLRWWGRHSTTPIEPAVGRGGAHYLRGSEHACLDQTSYSFGQGVKRSWCLGFEAPCRGRPNIRHRILDDLQHRLWRAGFTMLTRCLSPSRLHSASAAEQRASDTPRKGDNDFFHGARVACMASSTRAFFSVISVSGCGAT